MKFGVATVITDESIRPNVLAKALEERGFESLVVAEHSHIPASRATPSSARTRCAGISRETSRRHPPVAHERVRLRSPPTRRADSGGRSSR